MRNSLFVLLALAGCDGLGQRASAQRSGTITVTTEKGVIFDTAMLVAAVGSPVGLNIELTLNATVTASTAAYAEEVAATIALDTDSTDGVVRVRVAAKGADGKFGAFPADVRVSGVIQAVVPSALDFGVRGGGAIVRGVAGNIELETASGAEVYDAQKSVIIRTGGGVIVDTPLLQSTVLDVQANGSVRFDLPATPSATFILATDAPDKIFVKHPRLPQPLMGQSAYQTAVNGGLAQVRASAGGQITLNAR